MRFCADAVACAAGAGLVLPPKPGAAQLVKQLGGLPHRVLHLDDASLGFGAFDDGVQAAAWHREAQALLSSWCCTADPRFKRTAGVVPYLLPPLEGQAHWLGEQRLSWVAGSLSYSFDAAGDRAMAVEMHRSAVK